MKEAFSSEKMAAGVQSIRTPKVSADAVGEGSGGQGATAVYPKGVKERSGDHSFFRFFFRFETAFLFLYTLTPCFGSLNVVRKLGSFVSDRLFALLLAEVLSVAQEGTAQVGFAQVGTAQVGTAQVGTA